MKNADEEYQRTSLSIRADLTGRYVYNLDAIPVTYIIREYRA